MKHVSRRPDRAGGLTDAVFEAIVRDSEATLERLSRDFEGMYLNLVLADPAGRGTRLRELHPRRRTFLELGSGLGVITIIADLLGYDAYGVEIEPRLEEESRRLAESVGSNATFVVGSFVPPEFQQEVALLNADSLTITTGADAYDELGMDLGDFDLVYAYPWPDETEWLHALFRRYAGPDAALLSYSVRDGYVLLEREA